jgi:hypothetical protein
MKQLVTFEIQDGENEYRDYGIYDKKYSDEEIIRHFYGFDDIQEDEEGSGRYWRYDSLVSIRDRVDIDDDKIKIMKDYGVAYEHNI